MSVGCGLISEIVEIEKLFGGKPAGGRPSGGSATGKKGGEMMTTAEINAKVEALSGKTGKQLQDELRREAMANRR